MKHLSVRRVISFVLIFAMLLPMLQGLGPITFAKSNTEPIILIAGADYQQGWYDQSDIGKEGVTADSLVEWGEQSGSEFRAILDAMANDGYKNTVDAMLFCGDYSRWFMDETGTWKDDSIDEMVKLKNHLSESGLMESDADSFYLQGNHETKELDYAAWNNQLAPHYGQADDAAGSRGYGVFVMNEDVFPWQQGKSDSALATVQDTANRLKTYLAQTKADYGDDYPIFVLSHVPLHYTSRTYLAGDNLYAKYILDVLNEAGANGQTIIFLYGHNHSAGYDEYLGGSTNYIARGDSMWVANPANQQMYPNERTLSFTYMNAGFVGYYDTENTEIDSALTMSMFIIEDGKVTVKRFDKNGEHAVKAAKGQWYTGLEDGRLHDWQYGYTLNTDTYASPQTIDINELELELPLILQGEKLFHEDEYASVSVVPSASGTGSTYTWTSSDPEVLSVSASGTDTAVVNGVKAGTAVVTVTESGTGKTASFMVDVRTKGETVVLPATDNTEIYSLTSTFKDGHVYMIANSRQPGDSTAKIMLAPEENVGKVTEAGQTIHGYPDGTPYIIRNTEHGKFELFVFEQNPDMPNGVGWLRTIGSNWYHDDTQKWEFHYVRSDEHFYTWVSRDRSEITDPRSSLWGFRDDCVYNCQDDGKEAWWLFYPNLSDDTYIDTWKPYIFGLANGWDSALAYCTYIYEKTYLDTATSFSGKTGSVVVSGGAVSADSEIGVTLVLTRKDGKTTYVPMTLDMITGWPEGVSVSADGVVSGLSAGTYSGLGVEYEGTVLCGDLVLTVSDSEPVSAPLTSYYYRLTDTLVDGKDYLIVNRNTPGSAQVLTYAGANLQLADAVSTQVYLDASGVPCVRIGEGNCNDSMSKFTFDQVGISQGTVYGTFDAAGVSGINYLDSSTQSWTYDYSSETPTINYDDEYEPYQTQYGFCFRYLPNDGGLSAYRITSDGWRLTYYNTTQNKFMSMPMADRNDTCQVYLYERVEITEQTYELFGATGVVKVQDAPGAELNTGSFIKIQQADGSVRYVEVTTAMLDIPNDNIDGLPSDLLTQARRVTGLTVTYDGKVISTDYTLVVSPDTADGAGIPEYPNQGAVRVDKKADTFENDYFGTGVARVDLSVTGIPMQQGVDLLLVVDTSSSMNQTVDETGITRIQALQNAVDELITQLKVPNEDGTLPDIELGIVQFNDHTYFDTDDHLAGNKVFKYFDNENKSGIVQEFTNINTLSFDPEVITTKSGTNYDVGLQYAYQYLSEKKAANLSKGEDRKQVVVFMSDGICYQYNWLSNDATSDGSAAWQSWLEGTSDEVLYNGTQTYYEELLSRRGEYYAELFHTEGRNWIAEAIKGEAPAADAAKPTVDVTDTAMDVINGYYKVVFRDERINPNTYDDPPVTLAQSWNWVPGLEATIYTIGFGLSDENNISVDTGRHVLKMIANDPSMYTDAENSAALHQAFRSIGQSLRTAGEGAYVLDQMGSEFDLQLAQVTDDEGNATGFKPSIQVSTYDLYKFGEVGQTINGIAVTETMVGTRKSSVPGAVLETVTFSDDGTKAYSNCLTGNILTGGVICANTFWYNTNATDVTVDRDGDGIAETTLPAETFLWKIGAITEQEISLSYYVYLTKTTNAKAEGTDREAGNYATNTYADLHYSDIYGNPQTKTTVSPTLPWKQAQVSYGFYLVDGSGNVVVNAGTGTTGSFANKITLGSLTTKLLNFNDEHSDDGSIVAAQLTNIPSGYMLFDEAAAYSVHAHSSGGGAWNVTRGDGMRATTYVADYGADPTLQQSSQDGAGYDYSHTVVWFAVTLENSDMFVDKTVAAVEGTTDQFTLTLEAYATGSSIQLPSTKPADVVLVLDQSSTMYTPVGVDADRISIDVAAFQNNQYDVAITKTLSDTRNQLADYAITDFATKVNNGDEVILENAKHLGYYIAIHRSLNYIYIVQYAKNQAGQWGWYYVPVDSTVRTIEVDTEKYYTSTRDALVKGYDSASKTFQPYGYGTYVYGNAQLLDTSLVTYYKSQYGELYDTLQTFVADLKEESVRSGLDHRVAVVGFASPFYDGWTGYDGTGIYVDGKYHLYDSDYKYTKEDGTVYDPDKVFVGSNEIYNSNTVLDDSKLHDFNVSAQTYDDALVSVRDNYDSVLNSVKAYKANYQQTCPSIGISIAQSIFAARKSTANLFTNPNMTSKLEPGEPTYGNNGNTYNEDQDFEHLKSTYTADNDADRDEIIILFTDGVPTVRCSTDRDLGFSEHKAVAAEFWTITSGIDDVIDHAYDAKQAGIQIYGIGTSKAVMTQYGTKFFEHVSSDDPTAKSQLTITETWTTDTNGKYVLSAATPSVAISNSNYADSGYTMYASDEGMDLAKAFKTVYESIESTVDLDGTAVLKELITDYFDLTAVDESDIKVYTADYTGTNAAGKHQFSTKWTPLEGAEVSFASSDNSTRLDTVNVSGFSYHDEYVGEKDGAPRGKKLIVQLNIKARDGFWGGNNVPTNEPDTAIYTPDGEPVVYFPIPEANVPVKPVISAKNQVVYYGEDDLNALDDLVGSITVDGMPVVIDPTTGEFVPGDLKSTEDDWMDDYADLIWNPAENLDNPSNTTVSGTDSDTYTFGVVLIPKNEKTGEATTGESNTIEGDDNIAGDPIATTGIASDTVTGSVDILVPVITFEDSTIWVGDETDKAYYESVNRQQTVTWVNKDDVDGTAGKPTDATMGTKPELNFSYSIEGTGENCFTQDTPINVEVMLGDTNITGEAYFDWVDCESEHHDSGEDIAFHKGDVSSYEFNIHVKFYVNADTVVIDFGIPVDIDALYNDVPPTSAEVKLTGVKVGSTVTKHYSDAHDAAFLTTVNSDHGSLTLVDGKLRYTPSDMKMDRSETFIYEVEYKTQTQDENGQTVTTTRYYYSTVTVIPATIIYYEDNFLKFQYYTYSGTTFSDSMDGGWTPQGENAEEPQAQDRPGEGLSQIDAGNIYGYDQTYTDMATHSYGSAQKIRVYDGLSGLANFSFAGTGFDVIALSSNTTGSILVSITRTVTDAETNTETEEYVADYMVDTYYGYKFVDGEWVVDTEASNSLYQVPVIKVDLNKVVKVEDDPDTTEDETEYFGYGTYNVEIDISYADWLDHGQCQCTDSNCTGCFEFYLDAIRIYNPAGVEPEDDKVKDAYIKDHEYKPTYEELRNHLITANQFTTMTDEAPGIIFIDNTADDVASTEDYVPGISDYKGYGPNNELYLAHGQAVAFKLNDVEDIDRLHLAVKTVGGAAQVSLYGVEAEKENVTVLNNVTLNSATDLYYDITSLIGKTVVIRNSGDSGILSITNIKTTHLYEQSIQGQSLFSIDPVGAALALASMNMGEPDSIEPDRSGVVTPKTAAVSFEDEVKVNIFFTLDLPEDVQAETLGMITFDTQVENGTLENAQNVYTDVVYNAADDRYYVSTDGIPAKKIGDLIWFRVFAELSDGTVAYSELLSYSPKQYAYSLLNRDGYSSEIKALVAAMLNYGAAAQTFFGYRTDALVNADMTEEQRALAGGYSEDMFKGIQPHDAAKTGIFGATPGGFTKKSPAVSFLGAFSISYFMTTAHQPDSAPKLYVWTQADYDAARVLTPENASAVLTMTGDGIYTAAADGIAAKDLNATVYAASVYEAQGTTWCTGILPYSIGAYFANQAAKDGEAVQPLAQAAAVYASRAEAYFYG